MVCRKRKLSIIFVTCSQPLGDTLLQPDGRTLSISGSVMHIKVQDLSQFLSQPVFCLHELYSALEGSHKSMFPAPDMRLSQLLGHVTLLQLYLYNHLSQREHFSVSWKIATVVPLLKPGKSPNLIQSIRTVSSTGYLRKCMEKVIHQNFE